MQEMPGVYQLKDGLPVFIRLFRPSDINEIIIGFSKMSERSRYRRFFQSVRTLPDSHLNTLMCVDGRDNLAVCAGVIHATGWEGAGMARFSRKETNPKIADVGLTVIDKYQGKGLGGLLQRHLAEYARRKGVEGFWAFLFGTNQAMYKLFAQLGAYTRKEIEPGILRLEHRFDRPGAK